MTCELSEKKRALLLTLPLLNMALSASFTLPNIFLLVCSVRVCVFCVYVCVREKERERQRRCERESTQNTHTHTHKTHTIFFHFVQYPCSRFSAVQSSPPDSSPFPLRLPLSSSASYFPCTAALLDSQSSRNGLWTAASSSSQQRQHVSKVE